MISAGRASEEIRFRDTRFSESQWGFIGGSYSLIFLADLRRMNVSLFCVKMSFIIVSVKTYGNLLYLGIVARIEKTL